MYVICLVSYMYAVSKGINLVSLNDSFAFFGTLRGSLVEQSIIYLPNTNQTYYDPHQVNFKLLQHPIVKKSLQELKELKDPLSDTLLEQYNYTVNLVTIPNYYLGGPITVPLFTINYLHILFGLLTLFFILKLVFNFIHICIGRDTHKSHNEFKETFGLTDCILSEYNRSWARIIGSLVTYINSLLFDYYLVTIFYYFNKTISSLTTTLILLDILYW